jgi:uncharacterized RDD family membrane protein YckC
MNALDAIGTICPICTDRIGAGQSVVICDGCRNSYHAECYTFNGSCATLGCTGPIGAPRWPGDEANEAPPPKDLSVLLETYCGDCEGRHFVDAVICPHCGAPTRAATMPPPDRPGKWGPPPPPWETTGREPERPAPSPWDPPPVGHPTGPWPPVGHEHTAPPLVPDQRRLAGFGVRLGAWLIDIILLSVVQAFVVANVQVESGQGLGLLLGFVYFGIFQGTNGQSLGKKLVGIRIVRLDGSPVTVDVGILRWLATILSGLILCIGYFMAAWSENHQALHDQMVSTIVIYVDR